MLLSAAIAAVSCTARIYRDSPMFGPHNNR
jgi:hypothetical protein